MMGTYPHHPMVVSIAGRELRQALITILTPETSRNGIISFNIRISISIIIILLVMKEKHGIKKHVPFVDYITIHFLSVGKERRHTKGGGMKDTLNSR